MPKPITFCLEQANILLVVWKMTQGNFLLLLSMVLHQLLRCLGCCVYNLEQDMEERQRMVLMQHTLKYLN